MGGMKPSGVASSAPDVGFDLFRRRFQTPTERHFRRAERLLIPESGGEEDPGGTFERAPGNLTHPPDSAAKEIEAERFDLGPRMQLGG